VAAGDAALFPSKLGRRRASRGGGARSGRHTLFLRQATTDRPLLRAFVSSPLEHSGFLFHSPTHHPHMFEFVSTYPPSPSNLGAGRFSGTSRFFLPFPPPPLFFFLFSLFFFLFFFSSLSGKRKEKKKSWASSAWLQHGRIPPSPSEPQTAPLPLSRRLSRPPQAEWGDKGPALQSVCI